MGHLRVVIPPDILDDDWSEASAVEGGSVELKCSATGEPAPSVSWRRTGGRHIVFRDNHGKPLKGNPISLEGVFKRLILPTSREFSALYGFIGFGFIVN
ncbi:Neuronal growth regulator 1 [Eumeta japonica]|uniref:Neuronal growth regulator 1 n=1 Tax=Eumeta variegata TaxID=151549 RepID=A0A4C1X713_EUMVA|nr:Neuronal growth regulator 1 [Eumeta japonica]